MFVELQNPESISLWLVWLIPIAGSLVVPALGGLSDKAKGIFSVLVSSASFAVSLFMYLQLASPKSSHLLYSYIEWIPSLGFRFGVVLDPLSCLFALLIGFVGTLVLVYSIAYMSGEGGLVRYYALMLLFIGSMIALVMADNLIQLFIFWEMVGFCSYALVGFWYKRTASVRSATQVLLMTKIGDVALLVAMILLYLESGTFNLIELVKMTDSISPTILILPSLLLLFGAMTKSAQLPMHTWLFAAMEAPTSVSCLLHGATMVKAGVYLIARTYPLFRSVDLWLSMMSYVGLATAFLSATLALSTTDIKGVAAYSTISQIGYMMAGLGASAALYPLGWAASILHLINHAFFQGIGFLSAGIIVHQIGSRDLRRMGGLRRDLPATFAVSSITFLSRAAIPPFGGFYSKELLAETLLATENLPLILLFYLTSTLTVAYSLRLILLVYFGEKPENLSHTHLHNEPFLMIIPAIVFSILCGLMTPLLEPAISFLLSGAYQSHLHLSKVSIFIHTVSVILGVIPIGLFYLRGIPNPSILQKKPLQLVSRILGKGYYFDAFYREYILTGILLFSLTLRDSLEFFLEDKLPYSVAGAVSGLAYIIRMGIDTKLDAFCYSVGKGTMSIAQLLRETVDVGLDRLCYMVAIGTLSAGREIREHGEEELDKLSYTLAEGTVKQARGLSRTNVGLLRQFVVAIIIGIFLLSLLLVLSYPWS